MFSMTTTEPSTTMRSRAPEGEKVGGMLRRFRQMAAKMSAKGIVRATMMAPRAVAEKKEEDDDDEEDAFGEVVQDGVCGVVQKVAAVEEWNDL